MRSGRRVRELWSGPWCAAFRCGRTKTLRAGCAGRRTKTPEGVCARPGAAGVPRTPAAPCTVLSAGLTRPFPGRAHLSDGGGETVPGAVAREETRHVLQHRGRAFADHHAHGGRGQTGRLQNTGPSAPGPEGLAVAV